MRRFLPLACAFGFAASAVVDVTFEVRNRPASVYTPSDILKRKSQLNSATPIGGLARFSSRLTGFGLNHANEDSYHTVRRSCRWPTTPTGSGTASSWS